MNDEEIKNEIIPEEPLALDNSERVKVLSPGMMVFRRFIRNKLAIIGVAVLLFMFLFCFAGPLFSPYNSTQVFYTFEEINAPYATAVDRIEYEILFYPDFMPDDLSVQFKIKLVSDYRTALDDGGSAEITDADKNKSYVYYKRTDNAYNLCELPKIEAAVYRVRTGYRFNPDYAVYNTDDFKGLVEINLNGGFKYDGKSFVVSGTASSFTAYETFPEINRALITNYVVDAAGEGLELDGSFKIAAFNAAGISDTFTFDGDDYTLEYNDERNSYDIYTESAGENSFFGRITTFAVRDPAGKDTLSIEYKDRLYAEVALLSASGEAEAWFNYDTILPGEQDSAELEHYLRRQVGGFFVRVMQSKYVIDRYASPSGTHLLGTDSHGMDVLTRMMMGGRVSLIVAFVVVIIETILGVILGGIAGYFGKWVDDIIMRLVDIFNCLPFLPIMVMLGAMFDKLQMGSWARLMWMMGLMGFLGWAGVARLVRGQILSLREQEFMVAAEAAGLRPRRRIFRHLIPNVMPQLIVTATMGLGAVIILESTLSFLGLGAKFPMATWGAMIDSISTATELKNHTYIWIPIGLFISLTVIAFNFAGDGLRDAFDPKMKR